MKFKDFFVIGTDTDVGKTYVSTLLYKALRKYNFQYYKPIQSGCFLKDDELTAPDVDFLTKFIGVDYDDSMVTYTLKEEVSPHLASEMEGTTIEIENVKRVKAVKLKPSDTGLTIIGGNNNQGKTSVLDAITWALGGNRYKPSNATREGSVIPPNLKITMSNGLVVERKGKNSDLKVIDPRGEKAGQQLLDSFVEELALNLPKFMNQTSKEKATTLLQIIGVGDKLAELEGKEREVYFDARTKIHLQNYLNSRIDNNPALFVSLLRPYDRLKISGVEIRLRELGKRINIKKIHPHKFRRTMATKAIDKGMPIEQVQVLLGHRKIDTTLQYAMVNQNNVRNSHKKFIC